MEAKSGDRVSIDAKKVGQPRRIGVIRSVTRGLSGTRYQVRWEDGHESVISPGAGNLTIEGRAGNSKRASNSKPKRASAKKASSAKKKSSKRGR